MRNSIGMTPNNTLERSCVVGARLVGRFIDIAQQVALLQRRSISNGLFGVMCLLALAASLTACVPSTNIKQPLTARPLPQATPAAAGNGAIYQAGVNERPMFEDRRARNVGDV